ANVENVTVKANSTNIRSGPGTSYPAIGSSSSGDTYRLQKTDGDWHQIVLAHGEYGWVASWLTDTKGEPIPASNETAATVQAPEQQASSTSSDLTSLDGYNIML
ncbi:SH3 domain-containing protein, partial [Virgibacillus salexigens]|uniref:SH3 domain-containing protein n=1 Tax=Virgibacillus salexigens TaxID=61016 RepID=UPI00190BF77B